MYVSLQEPKQWKQQKQNLKARTERLMPLLTDVAGPASGKKEDGLIFLLLLGFNKCLHKLKDKPFRGLGLSLPFYLSGLISRSSGFTVFAVSTFTGK